MLTVPYRLGAFACDRRIRDMIGKTKNKTKVRIGLPTPLVSEAISHGSHVVPDCGPFRATDNSNVFDGQDGEK